MIDVDYEDHMGSDLSVVNASVVYRPYAKYHFRMVEALDKGYSVVDGVLYGPRGKLGVKRRGKQRYPTFSTNWGGVQSLPVHVFAAFCYYGYEVFNPNLQVRHLNGDTEDISRVNIVLGTPSENQLDKAQSKRAEAARKARASQGAAAINRKLSEADQKRVMEFYDNLEGKKAANGLVKKLCEEIGISRTALRSFYKGKTYVV